MIGEGLCGDIQPQIRQQDKEGKEEFFHAILDLSFFTIKISFEMQK